MADVKMLYFFERLSPLGLKVVPARAEWEAAEAAEAASVSTSRP